MTTETVQATRTWFVDEDMQARLVCELRHRRKTECPKPHCVPESAIWAGQVDDDIRGDFLIDLRKARKGFRRAWRRWRRERVAMSTKLVAPQFKAYMESLIKKHDLNEPRFRFTWSNE